MPAVSFRVARVPVSVEPSFLVVAALVALFSGRGPGLMASWVAVAAVSILWHELGHAAALRAFGLHPHIRLHGMGGETSAADAQLLAPAKDVVASAAGPGAGLLLGGVVVALGHLVDASEANTWVEAVVRDLVWVNVAWAAFNLVPMLPLDGGRIMAAGLRRASNGRAERAALVVSVVVGAGLAVAAALKGLWVVGVLVLFFAVANGAELKRLRPMRDPADDDRALAEGFGALAQGATLAAANRAREILSSSGVAATRGSAAELLMWCHLLENRVDDAVEAAREAGEASTLQPVLNASVLAATGGVDGALAALRRAFEARPGGVTGTRLARALIDAGRLDEARALASGRDTGAAGLDAALLVAAALFQAGRLDEAADLGARCFERSGHPVLAYNLACTKARQGHRDEALTWLGRAVDAGFGEADAIDSDPDLAPLRSSHRFGEIRRRVKH